MLVPSGTLCNAIATITNRLNPARSEAYAVPIAKPSGRLCTKRTANTRNERRRPRPRRPSKRGRSMSRLEATRKTTPAARPAATSTIPPSWSAGRRSPATEATVIIPTVPPKRSGRSFSARAPRKNTGIAPRPVARAVPVAARTRTTSSMRGRHPAQGSLLSLRRPHRPRPGARRAAVDDHDRSPCMLYDPGRDAAEQRSHEGAVAARADDDQAGVTVVCERDDLLGWIPFENLRVGCNAPRLSASTRVVHDGLRLAETSPDASLVERVAEHSRGRPLHGDERHADAELRGKPESLLDRGSPR